MPDARTVSKTMGPDVKRAAALAARNNDGTGLPVSLQEREGGPGKRTPEESSQEIVDKPSPNTKERRAPSLTKTWCVEIPEQN